MQDRRFDVLAIGNAIVDVIADADDQFLKREGMHKGAMQLIDEAEAVRLYEAMASARETSGGSARSSRAMVPPPAPGAARISAGERAHRLDGRDHREDEEDAGRHASD